MKLSRVGKSALPLAFCLGVLFGVVVINFLCLAIPPFLFALAFGLALVLSLIVHRKVLLSILMATSIGLLSGGFRAAQLVESNQYLQQSIGFVTITGTVEEDSMVKNGETRVVINDLSLTNDKPVIRSRIYLILSDNRELNRSDRITLQGNLQPGFGVYAGFIWHPAVVAVDKPDPPDYALSLRHAFSHQISQLLPNELQAKLALGYLLGQKTASTDFDDKLKIVGLSHIVVASGYNLSILVDFSKKKFGKISRFATLAGASIFLVFFISITGCSASMIRAGIIAGLSLFAWYFGRHFHPARIILYAVAITLLCNPGYIQDLGWWLSFAAYAGIMFISPLITSYLYGEQKPSAVSDMTIQSIAAQMMCLPISIYSFGYFSVLGVFAGLIIMPMIPLMMLFSFILGLFGLFIGGLFPLLGWSWLAVPLRLSYELHILVVETLSKIPWGTFELGAQNSQIFLLYLPIITFAVALWRKTQYRFWHLVGSRQKQKYGKIYAC